jgi:hypothetical protein
MIQNAMGKMRSQAVGVSLWRRLAFVLLALAAVSWALATGAGFASASGRLRGIAARRHKTSTTNEYFEYQTLYEGTYTFDTHFQESELYGGVPPNFMTHASYRWQWLYEDRFEPTTSGEFTETLQETVLANGKVLTTGTQGGTPPANPAEEDCTIKSVPGTRTLATRKGFYSEAVPLKKNPLIEVTWELPIVVPEQVTVSGPYNFGPTTLNPGEGAITSCAQLQADVLPYQADGGNFVFLDLPSSPEWQEAWRGNKGVHVKKLLKKEITVRKFKAMLGPKTQNSGFATETGGGSIDGTVTFNRLQLLAPRKHEPASYNPWDGPTELHKIGALFEDDAIRILSGAHDVNGVPSLGFGDPSSVLLPGMPGPGSASTSVSGQVIPSASSQSYGARVATAGHSYTLIATAKAQVPGGGEPFTLTLQPSGAATTLLAANHPAIELKATFNFRPDGYDHTFTTTVTEKLPAGA